MQLVMQKHHAVADVRGGGLCDWRLLWSDGGRDSGRSCKSGAYRQQARPVALGEAWLVTYPSFGAGAGNPVGAFKRGRRVGYHIAGSRYVYPW